jgi:RNA polymerase sigma-70 factor, ECF subfamily
METTIEVRFQAKEMPLLRLSRKATDKLKDGPSRARDIPKPARNLCVAATAPSEGAKTSEHTAELELVRRSQAGDTEAFGQLITRYRSKIFATVYGMVCNEHDARDLAQEAFLKAWQSIHRFQGRSSFYTWLYRIAMNVTICSLRQKRGLEEGELHENIPSSLPSPGLNCQRIEIGERVDSALAKLSSEHRAVIVLKELEGLQYHEIAAVLKISIGTVMSRLFYARKHLQSLLRSTYDQM